MDRRDFLKTVGAVGVGIAAADASASTAVHAPPDAFGVLVDTTACIGCRKCEWACNQVNKLPVQPLEEFENKDVFAAMRRPDAGNFTVVNQWQREGREGNVWAKVQCLHCNDPACASACLVSALEKQPNGAVKYDPWRCMGCRYCMVACPFQIPAYQYQDALSPEVRKCTFCIERISAGERPGCVEICPVECLIYGKREELLTLAHERIGAYPGRYVDHVYGEHEVGGTSWLYLAGQPFPSLGFPELGEQSPARITENIQHGIFRRFIAPVALYATLAQVMWLGSRKDEVAAAAETAEHRGEEHHE